MRVPRFVFALLLVAIVVLGSSLAVMKARAQTEGTVLILTATPPGGRGMRCALSLRDSKMASCAAMDLTRAYAFRIMARDGERVEIGVRLTSWTPAAGNGVSLDDILKGVEEKEYWFDLGNELRIPFPGSGTMVITGELTDYVPTLLNSAPDEPMDPKAGELRFVAPVLVQGKEVLNDFEGFSAIAHRESQGIEMYVPNEGLYRISLSELQGAVKGRVTRSRISFELNGQAYEFLLAAPVTRSEHVWIQFDGDFKPSAEMLQHGFITVRDESGLLVKPSEKN